MRRVVVVGGGVLGMMHAAAARERGTQVVQLERERGARGASVRNFGLVWVSGRAAGAELALALRASTHSYDELFDFDVDEAPYDHLRARAEDLLGTALPPVRRRWAGVYSQAIGPRIYHRSEVAPGVVLVTGPGGRGMTLAPAIAEETLAA